MKNIGLITLYERNYGSALQCYATKRTIENMGFHCDVIGFENQGIDKFRHYGDELKNVVWNSIRYKGYYTDYRKTRSARIHYSHSLSKESAHRIWMFTESVLQAQKLSESTLRTIGADDSYVKFITGSDQVWNGHKNINPNYFLRFAPEGKRMSLSASFGADSIPDYNRRRITKYLNGTPTITVREEAGQRLVKELTGRQVDLLSDPTVLLDASEWRVFAQDAMKHTRPYMLAHFLDQPCKETIDEISSYANIKGLDLLLFAYPHEGMNQDTHFLMIDGGPEDYVSLIDGAELVCTDSFHSALFSINLGTKFIVYPRQYRHDHPQASRLETLLSKYGYTDRLRGTESSINQIAEKECHECRGALTEERNKILSYLSFNLLPFNQIGHSVPTLRDINDCTGCGVCSLVCQQHAITMRPDEVGSYSPIIDVEKCIKCGACEAACFRKIAGKEGAVKAYVGYNTNDSLALQSASGGVFSATATEIIRRGGAVYGAVMEFDSDGAHVIHKRASTQEELLPLLKSKYVQSDCSVVFAQIREDLKEGINVLFCGTSCQVNALYRFLGSRNYLNLYTIDLICHGVPGQELFSDYIQYLGSKQNNRVSSFDFRTKRDGAIQYEMKVGYEGNGEYEYIPKFSSAYYRLFMSMNSYRECCYHCEYASINKPADITIGDYFEVQDDYPELCERELKNRFSISSVLVRNEKGNELLRLCGEGIKLIPVDTEKVQSSHGNLRKPSQYSSLRNTFFKILNRSGFAGVERYFKRRDALMALPKKVFKR